MVWFASLVHLFQGVALLFYPEAGNATPTKILVDTFGHHVIAGIGLIIVSSFAVYSLLRHRGDKKGTILYLIPQQIIMMLSAYESSQAIILSQYADGVIRSRAFIFADQMATIMAAIVHTVAIIDIYTIGFFAKITRWKNSR
jgi:hypothetical protein